MFKLRNQSSREGNWCYNMEPLVPYSNQVYQAKLPLTLDLVRTVPILTKAVPKVEGWPELSAKEYDKQEALLCRPRDRDGKWPDLDTEFAYRRFHEVYVCIEKYHHEVVMSVTYTKDTVQEVGVEQPYIKPFHQVGEDLFKPWGEYDRYGYWQEVIHQIAEEYVFVLSGAWTRLPHEYRVSALDSSKRISLYVGNEELLANEVLRPVKDAMDELEKLKEADLRKIRRLFQGYVGRQAAVPSIQDVLRKLKHLSTMLKDIKVYAKDATSYRAAQSYLATYIAELQNRAERGAGKEE